MPIVNKNIFFALSYIFSFLSVFAEETQGFLTAEDIALFHKQGYLLKQGCLNPSEVDHLSQDVSEAIDHALGEIRSMQEPSLSEEEQILYVERTRVIYKRPSDLSISIARMNGCSGIQPALLNTVRSEKMLWTFFELLGTHDIEHLISQIHPKLPGDGIAYPGHQDIQFRKSFDPNWEDVLGNGSYAICIIPIDPMSFENGGLWIDTNSYPKQQEMESRVWIHAKPGDLFFMHPHLYHGSGPNLNPTASRKTLLTGFCAFGANHKTYPGADVNTRFTITKEGSIEMTATPWTQGSSIQPINGH